MKFLGENTQIAYSIAMVRIQLKYSAFNLVVILRGYFTFHNLIDTFINVG